jgi:hypothetical protein
MGKLILPILLMLTAVGVTLGQNTRSWVGMSPQDAERVLSNSPWGQTQTDTDTSEMFYSPTKAGTGTVAQSANGRASINDQTSINNSRADRGATNQAVSVNYRIRFLSAKPIREAISRLAMTERHQPVEDFEGLMQPFVDRDFSQYIVVIVTFDSTDGRFSGPAFQAFSSSTADTLKNSTYLERKDGKRLYLMEFRAPQDDGLGAKYVFPRIVDGKPFLTADSGNVRFYSEVGGKIKLNVKYKVADMVRDGKLEY